MTFAEAYEQMKAGKKVARPGFKGFWFINQETGIFTIQLPDGKQITYGKLDLTVRNTAASDWYVIED